MIKKSRWLLIFITGLLLFFNSSSALFSPGTSFLNRQTPQVLVIGAGISGLAAANTLIKNHIPVLVLEARNRIGGRIFTAHTRGLPLELGASWIHGIHNNPIAKLAEQHGLATIATDYSDQEGFERFKSFVFHNAQGKKISEAETKNILTLAEEFEHRLALSTEKNSETSVEDKLLAFIQEKHLDKRTSQLFYYIAAIVYTHEHAADLNVLSVNFINISERSKVSGKNVLLPSGYNQILPELVKNVPLALNQKVKKISYGAQGVDIYTDKNHFHSDYAIITVPLGVLKAGIIKFTPVLPLKKQHSIKKMRMGVYDKVYLLFNKPFWDKDSEWIGYTPKNPRDTIDIMNYYKVNKTPVLLMFTAGSLAERLELLDDQKIVAYMMKILRTIYGESIPNPSFYSITRWKKDPFSYGSYSYLPRGETLSDFQELAEPVLDRLFFAGEATSITDPATVHGAYETGVRAASEILSLIDKNTTNSVSRRIHPKLCLRSHCI